MKVPSTAGQMLGKVTSRKQRIGLAPNTCATPSKCHP